MPRELVRRPVPASGEPGRERSRPRSRNHQHLHDLHDHVGNRGVVGMLRETNRIVDELRGPLRLPADVEVHVGEPGSTHPSTRTARGVMEDGVVHLNAAHYNPGTTAGRRLLAHELAHVSQLANQGPARPGAARPGAAEVEAAGIAGRFAAGLGVGRATAVLDRAEAHDDENQAKWNWNSAVAFPRSVTLSEDRDEITVTPNDPDATWVEGIDKKLQATAMILSAVLDTTAYSARLAERAMWSPTLAGDQKGMPTAGEKIKPFVIKKDVLNAVQIWMVKKGLVAETETAWGKERWARADAVLAAHGYPESKEKLRSWEADMIGDRMQWRSAGGWSISDEVRPLEDEERAAWVDQMYLDGRFANMNLAGVEHRATTENWDLFGQVALDPIPKGATKAEERAIKRAGLLRGRIQLHHLAYDSDFVLAGVLYHEGLHVELARKQVAEGIDPTHPAIELINHIEIYNTVSNHLLGNRFKQEIEDHGFTTPKLPLAVSKNQQYIKNASKSEKKFLGELEALGVSEEVFDAISRGEYDRARLLIVASDPDARYISLHWRALQLLL